MTRDGCVHPSITSLNRLFTEKGVAGFDKGFLHELMVISNLHEYWLLTICTVPLIRQFARKTDLVNINQIIR